MNGFVSKNTKNLANSINSQLSHIKDSKIISSGTFILVKIDCDNKNGEILLFDNLDFSLIKSLLIKELKSGEYRKVFTKEILNYSMSGDFLNLKLRNNEKLKIRIQ